MIGFIEDQDIDCCSQSSDMEQSLAKPSKPDSGINSEIAARELPYQPVERKGG
jgi:hypothetical protein